MLTTLEVHLGPAETVQPFAVIISSAGYKVLSGLHNFPTLRLGTLSVSLHDLTKLMHGWQSLKTLKSSSSAVIAPARARCSGAPSGAAPGPFMTNDTLGWLLEGQIELERVSLPVQGLEGVKILNALEKVMNSLRSLDLRDMWVDQHRSDASEAELPQDQGSGDQGRRDGRVRRPRIVAFLPKARSERMPRGCAHQLHNPAAQHVDAWSGIGCGHLAAQSGNAVL